MYIISASVRDQVIGLPWRVDYTVAQLSATKSSVGCFILPVVPEPSADCISFSYVIILLRMCNLSKISFMPWFQSLLFEYKSSASSVVAEYKRVEVNILLVAVCSTFSIVKLVFGSFFNKTLVVVKLSDTWKVLSCQSAFGLCYLTLKWYTKILLILH